MKKRGVVVGQPFWVENGGLKTIFLEGSELDRRGHLDENLRFRIELHRLCCLQAALTGDKEDCRGLSLAQLKGNKAANIT